MGILNYFFIGFGFCFFIDLLLNTKYIKDHHLMVDKTWGWNERLICIVIWPIASLVFLYSFFSTFFKR